MKGYDFYSMDMDIYDFLEYIKNHNISIYRLQKNKKYTFYSTYKYRKVLNHELIHYKYSVGMIGMLFRFNIEKIISFVLSSILLFALSNTIFDVEIVGESIQHKEMIQDKLKSFKIPFFYFNDKSISKHFIQLNQELNWYEIIRNGSNIQIHYLPRYNENKTINHTYDLIAEKEGIIASFDVKKGNKIVALNQKVNKGDLLVSKITIDSRSNEKTSDVIGSVYAYTFQKVDIEIENRYPIGLGYYICLLESRLQLELDEDEKIMKEISLHFSEDLDTIRISNYYVLYEKISIVGE